MWPFLSRCYQSVDGQPAEGEDGVGHGRPRSKRNNPREIHEESSFIGVLEHGGCAGNGKITPLSSVDTFI